MSQESASIEKLDNDGVQVKCRLAADDDDSDQEEPEYELERIMIDGNIALEIWSVVPPPLEYLMQLATNRQEISGRQVWTGSLVLSHVLCRLHDQDANCFSRKRILELGSGTGVVGMVVSKLASSSSSSPASCIALTDGDIQAVQLLDKNLKNPCNAIPSHEANVCLLPWGNDALPPVNRETDKPETDRTANATFEDWCRQEWNMVWKDGEPIQFDLLLAGDVLYKEELPQLFFETVERYLTKDDGVLWLCHVPRASVTHDVVVATAQQSGFNVELYWSYDNCALFEGCPLEDLSRAKVYKITRSGENNK